MPEPKEISVTVADGKYTVVLTNAGGTHALRHGLVWRDCTGDNLIAALANELAEARNKISAATNCLIRHPTANTTEVLQNALTILIAEEE